MSGSFDFGRNWSKAELSDIQNADTKVTCLKIKDTILLINNDAPFKKRVNLAISKSKDRRVFGKVLNVDEKTKAFFYAHAFADDEHEILYVAYENCKEHFLAKYRLINQSKSLYESRSIKTVLGELL